ncbi:hypothetical protein ACTQ4K_10530, partial [Clostridium sporogenes]|uniref:hypothetical protein n=1 Tax=Clostridium sporogenes TaxID=1509 RepID=UPI003F8DBDA4
PNKTTSTTYGPERLYASNNFIITRYYSQFVYYRYAPNTNDVYVDGYVTNTDISFIIPILNDEYIAFIQNGSQSRLTYYKRSNSVFTKYHDGTILDMTVSNRTVTLITSYGYMTRYYIGSNTFAKLCEFNVDLETIYSINATSDESIIFFNASKKRVFARIDEKNNKLEELYALKENVYSDYIGQKGNNILLKSKISSRSTYLKFLLAKMEMYLKINNQLKQYENGWIRINGQLREINNIDIKINGQLKEG